MATQLTLITVPVAPAADEITPDSGATGAAIAVEPVGTHRRPAGQVGWLDRSTIATGRRGVARARAALAEATRRTALEAAERDAARGRALAHEADRLADPAASHHNAA